MRKTSRVRPGRGVLFATSASLLVPAGLFVRVLGGCVDDELGGFVDAVLARFVIPGLGISGPYDGLPGHRDHRAGSDLELGPSVGQRTDGAEDPRGEHDLLPHRPPSRPFWSCGTRGCMLLAGRITMTQKKTSTSRITSSCAAGGMADNSRGRSGNGGAPTGPRPPPQRPAARNGGA